MIPADPLLLALRFAAALALGVLLGLERERTQRPEGGFAGVRTFGLISLAGALAAYLMSSSHGRRSRSRCSSRWRRSWWCPRW